MIKICAFMNLIIYLAVQIDSRKENREILLCGRTSQSLWPQQPEAVRLYTLRES